jgi:hypothetical protein
MCHEALVCYAEFSPDGQRVATAALDRTARVWDAATGQPLSEPLVHDGRVVRARFSPDGRWLLTAARHGHLWELFQANSPAPPWLADLAEAVAGRCIGPDGFEVAVEPDRLAKIRRLLAGRAQRTPYERWGNWFLADRTARLASPASRTRAAAIRERLSLDRSLAGAREKVRQEPGNGSAWASLAQRVLKQEFSDTPYLKAESLVYQRRGKLRETANSR